MRYVRGLCFGWWALLICGAQADTIPTLTATAGSASWGPCAGNACTGGVSGPDFVLSSPVTGPLVLPLTPCPPSFPPGGCVAPGPALSLYAGPQYDPQLGSVTLGGTTYQVYYEGNAQIQYLTPVIAYPAPSPGISSVTIPVILSGSERACLPAPNHYPLDPCLDYLGTPGYPNYIANIAINVPGTLTLFGNGGPSGNQLSGALFVSPEPRSIALAFIGFLVLLAAYGIRSKRTS